MECAASAGHGCFLTARLLLRVQLLLEAAYNIGGGAIHFLAGEILGRVIYGPDDLARLGVHQEHRAARAAEPGAGGGVVQRVFRFSHQARRRWLIAGSFGFGMGRFLRRRRLVVRLGFGLVARFGRGLRNGWVRAARRVGAARAVWASARSPPTPPGSLR